MGRKFTVVASCDFPYLWRYNLLLSCEMCDAAGERINFAYEERRTGEIGCQMKRKPADWKPSDVVLSTIECDHIRALLYVNPHTMPAGREVEALPPFEVRVKVTDGEEILYNKIHYVDQRGGASISITLP